MRVERNASNTSAVTSVAARGRAPPVNALLDTQHVRARPRPAAGEPRAGAAEAGEDLVGDEQRAVAAGEVGDRAQVRGVVHVSIPAAPSSSGSTITAATRSPSRASVARNASTHAPTSAPRTGGGTRVTSNRNPRKSATNGPSADTLDGPHRVAVVRVLERDEPRAGRRPAARVPRERDLQRDLDGGAAVIAVEDAREARRRQRHQAFGEVHGRPVRRAAELHVVEGARLAGDRGRDRGMAVPPQARSTTTTGRRARAGRRRARASRRPPTPRAAATGRARVACTGAR